MSTRIAIVGAGPVGAVTALAMARNGLDVTLLETDESYDEKPRAATTHASTLEMLAGLGIVDEVLRQGLVSPRFQHWDRVTGELVAEFDYSRLADETPYPYALQCESHKLVEYCAGSARRTSQCAPVAPTRSDGGNAAWRWGRSALHNTGW